MTLVHLEIFFIRTRISVVRSSVIIIGLLLVAFGPATAAVRLPAIIGDNMVLQCDCPLPIWGWAEPGEEVAVAIDGNAKTTTANVNGEWIVRLQGMEASDEAVELTVTGSSGNMITVINILIGEVWIGSGQSNMEWALESALDGQVISRGTHHPKIRLFHVPRTLAVAPVTNVSAKWVLCSPETAPRFSAVLYHFGLTLQAKVGVPVGLIESAWGGSRIEPWTPPEGFASESVLAADSKPQHVAGSWLNPTTMYNGMIHALVPFAIRGVLWYQGESNRGAGMHYYHQMKGLIQGWRHIWKQGDFPFYFVQLAPFNYAGNPLALPLMWEAQTAVLSVPNTGMVVTTDISTIDNIHPPNKRDVGKRLALWALAKDYGWEQLIHSGPLYDGYRIEGGGIRISFLHAGSGLLSNDGKGLNWFAIAGDDREFVEAIVEIDGETLFVHSPEVPKPVAVRFAWHQNAQPNFFNNEGLPASPFRTDRW